MPTVTHDLLYSNLLSTNTTSVTISGFSSAYTDLILVITGNSTGTFSPRLQFNGDTASNYMWQSMEANSNTPVAFNSLSETGLQLANSATASITNAERANWYVNILGYKGTSQAKPVFSRGVKGGSTGVSEFLFSSWKSTSAITSILLYSSNGNNLTTGSTIYMYGVL